MSRLIVEAVSAESTTSDSIGEVVIFVSVARASNGKPVTGLTKDNFRLVGRGLDIDVDSCGESKWRSSGSEFSGCYMLLVSQAVKPSVWIKGDFFQFGVQVRTFKGKKKTVVDCGQTAIDLESLGT